MLNSRERIRSIINHKEADKIPIDCGAMHSSGISAITYNVLKKHLDITDGETKVYDVNQQLALPEQWFLDMFSIDSVDLSRFFADNEGDWNKRALPDGSSGKYPSWMNFERRKNSWVVVNSEGEVLSSLVDGSFYFDQEIYPYFQKNIESFDDLQANLNKISWMVLTDPMMKNSDRGDFYPLIGEMAKQKFEETDYSLIANYGSLLFEPGQWLYRNDEFFMKMLSEPKEVMKLFEKLTEIHLNNLEPYLKQVDTYADVLIMADDLGMQAGPLISPKLYKEMIFPWHKEIFNYVKKNSGLKTFLHSCGSIIDILPHLIDAGLDIINPVQTQTVGMDPLTLKKEFGKDLVFWGGGIDTQHILASADEKTVRAEVRRNCEIFMKDGGFVFTAIHNMLPGIPPENIIAMFDEVNSIRY